MPSRNVQKPDIPESYYHVYARGASKQTIFLDSSDFQYFVNLFSRYLSAESKQDRLGVAYPHLYGKIELLAYCLMGNHFHLLLYQVDKSAMRQLMKSIMTSYSRYYNYKYHRTGSLYESTYKASLITSESYLLHISRYVHLNPRYWLRYNYSSINYYLSDRNEEWLNKDRVLQNFNDKIEYKNFLIDYEEQKHIIDELKMELANL